jgi:hypothetical protein
VAGIVVRHGAPQRKRRGRASSTGQRSAAVDAHLLADLHDGADEEVLVPPPARGDAGAKLVHDGADAITLRGERWRERCNEEEVESDATRSVRKNSVNERRKTEHVVVTCVEKGGESTTSAEGGTDTGDTVRFHISWNARRAATDDALEFDALDARASVDASRAESHRPVRGSAPSPAAPTRENTERTARGLRATAAAKRASSETRKRIAATASA